MTTSRASGSKRKKTRRPIRLERWTDQQIRSRSLALIAAGHPHGRGHPRRQGKATVIQVLMTETGLSRQVLHRVLNGNQTRGGARKATVTRPTAPARVSDLLGSQMARLASQGGAPAAVPVPGSPPTGSPPRTLSGAPPEARYAATIAELRSTVLDLQRQVESLQTENTQLRQAQQPGATRAQQALAAPPAVTKAWDPVRELQEMQESLEGLLHAEALPMNVRQLLRQLIQDIDRLR